MLEQDLIRMCPNVFNQNHISKLYKTVSELKSPLVDEFKHVWD